VRRRRRRALELVAAVRAVHQPRHVFVDLAPAERDDRQRLVLLHSTLLDMETAGSALPGRF
jgi:hypothetical protein